MDARSGGEEAAVFGRPKHLNPHFCDVMLRPLYPPPNRGVSMGDVTYILGQIEDGDDQAAEKLLPRVFHAVYETHRLSPSRNDLATLCSELGDSCTKGI